MKQLRNHNYALNMNYLKIVFQLHVSSLYGVTNWDINEKSSQISSFERVDKHISYAMINGKQRTFESILMNEWIGILDDKYIYRYLFKIRNQLNSNAYLNLPVGIITQSTFVKLEANFYCVGT